MHTLITSSQNPKIKSLLQLEKPRERRKQCQFMIEGVKEITLALAAGYEIRSLFFCESIIPVREVLRLGIPEREIIPVSREVFERLARREGSGGVLAVATMKLHPLENIALPENPLVVVLEAVEKPGNLGAILRTSDAARVDAVVVCDLQTDFYNPNVIRSSLGTVFTVPVATASSEDTWKWLLNNHMNIYCTSLRASKPYHDINFCGPSAFVLGTEATGLSEFWLNRSTSDIIIPMEGRIDSMNVSTAAAVIIFEAKRQRAFSAK